jgi:hypothetical protein
VARGDGEDVVGAYRALMKWSFGQDQFLDAAQAEFASKADAWLVAYAKVTGHVVVTEEVFAPNIKKQIEIPNACRAFSVPCINTFEMLRDLGGIGEQVAATRSEPARFGHNPFT